MNRFLEHGSLEYYINAMMLLVATLCKSYSAFITHAWLPNTTDLCDSSTDGFMDILQTSLTTTIVFVQTGNLGYKDIYSLLYLLKKNSALLSNICYLV